MVSETERADCGLLVKIIWRRKEDVERAIKAGRNFDHLLHFRENEVLSAAFKRDFNEIRSNAAVTVARNTDKRSQLAGRAGFGEEK